MIQVMILVTNLVKLYDHVHKNPLQLCNISASTFSALLCSRAESVSVVPPYVRVIERWAKSPRMSFVLDTTQRCNTWRRWHTCCSVKRCLQLVVGSQCWFLCRHFPCCQDAEMADLSLVKKSLHDSLSDVIDWPIGGSDSVHIFGSTH